MEATKEQIANIFNGHRILQYFGNLILNYFNLNYSY